MKITDTEPTMDSNEALDAPAADVDVMSLPTIEFTQQDFDFLTAANITAETPDAPHASDAEIAAFLEAKNIEPGQDVIANIDGNVRVIDTRVEDFGTTIRQMTDQLQEMMNASGQEVADSFEAETTPEAIDLSKIDENAGKYKAEDLKQMANEARELAVSEGEEVKQFEEAVTDEGLEQNTEVKTEVRSQVPQDNLEAIQKEIAVLPIEAQRAVKDYELYMSSADREIGINGHNRDAEESRRRAEQVIHNLPSAMQDLAKRYYQQLKDK